MTPSDEVPDARQFLLDCLNAAIARVQPGPAMERALAHETRPSVPVAVLAVGKAAPGMAVALEDWLASQGMSAGSGLVISATPARPAGTQYRAIVGDHPDPKHASAAAAQIVGEFVATLPAACDVHVAISGGASALMAEPLHGITEQDLAETFAILQRAGLAIDIMNAVRKRVTRWSAGRLAIALHPRSVRVWVMSDVVGDAVDAIGSGPCSGDPWSSEQVQDQMERAGITSQLPPRVRSALALETPKPGDRRFAKVRATVVASNRDAVGAAAQFARSHDVATVIAGAPLTGDAAVAGRAIAAAAFASSGPTMYCSGGETTVRRDSTTGRGGRAQELALSAAQAIRGQRITVLACGTDGRDGPTDAAGAIVDGGTWAAMEGLGANPEGALALHDSYPALERAGALVRTGPTGTNVMDVVLALTDSA